jgi:hypothetical protein
MKKKLLLLLSLFVLFGIFIGIKIFVLDRKEAQGSLKVLSSPTATVSADGKNVGKTPLDINLLVGEHLIKLTPDSTATDTASWSGKVQIYKNSRTFVDRELGASDNTSSGVIFSIKKSDKAKKGEGEIEIETDPIGSIIYLDNDEKGIAPLLLESVPQGEHELSVYSPGFIRRTQKINVESGYQVVAQFKIALDPSYQKVDEPTDEATPSAKTETKESTPSAKTTPPAKTSGKLIVVVKDTPTGFLRVREEPTLNASESARVNPGAEFEVMEEKSGWYQITYEKGKTGWISAQYTSKK